ncbi:DUF4097 family beta strand repeat-containing protein [Pseudactinotalea sp.]|uniref:DUF4097 family beta strand repeat-containing protein n=1 Tax=Pseudactinotalea sp. TaxID=1926260 RepID=UPI003B3B7A85
MATIASLVLVACGSADDAEPDTTSFAVAGDHLTITKNSGGEIELRPGDSDRVEVTRWFSGSPDDATWDLVDDELLLATDCGFLSSCDVQYRVTIPRDLAVTLESSNGDVLAADFDTAVSIHTENGAITVTDVSGELVLRSTSGDQQASGISSDKVEAHAENGTVDLGFTDTPSSVTVSTENGAVTLRLPDDPYDVTVSTDNGSVTQELTQQANSPHTIDVTTENGAIDLRPH